MATAVASATAGPAWAGLPAGTSLEHSEDDRHNRDGDQHDHRAGDGRCEEPPEEREPRGHEELEERGTHDERGQERRSPFRDRRDAHPDKGARAPHDEHLTRADPPVPDRLQQGARAGDCDRGDRGPRQIVLRRAGDPHHRRRNQNRNDDREHGELEPQAGREADRRRLVRLVAKPGPVGPPPCRSSRDGGRTDGGARDRRPTPRLRPASRHRRRNGAARGRRRGPVRGGTSRHPAVRWSRRSRRCAGAARRAETGRRRAPARQST